ncbi:MAG: hypothetical protein ACE5I1_15235 [bacterium]
MDFVDDFRYFKNPDALVQPFVPNQERFDALLASTAMYLCDELAIACPQWILRILACENPWFVSGMESLKAITLVESPVHFRLRKIFVLENFLSRV